MYCLRVFRVMMLMNEYSTQETCAEYMLYALLNADRGVFLRSPTANVFSSRVFDAPVDWDTNSPTASQAVHTTFIFADIGN
jgi:hypothetical protein